MKIFTSFILSMRFLLEIITIASFSYYGFKLDASLFIKGLAGIGIPLLIMIIWGFFGSPAAPFLLKGKAHVLLEIVIYSFAALVLIRTGHPILGTSLWVIAIINRIMLSLT
ncbi:YrdB family protein [Gracilibacillus sp. YIM 98692]|uniref:YrdB family protein n=1 Tax=Gracilibacillus sp. YIM 98692 TaxID=2663532 RepID=UPI0013D866B7|nr:YrdB family protein [Gracilibacillus sp. YIM 98692]